MGHWKDNAIRDRVGIWTRVAVAWHDWKSGKVARFGDNMRDVAVTEGDKVEAQIRFGFSVSGFGINDLVNSVKEVDEGDVARLVDEYMTLYDVGKAGQPGGEYHGNVRVQARYELGIKAFLEAGGFTAFTTTFEELHGLTVAGLAVRLMAQGYGLAPRGLETCRPGASSQGDGAGLPGYLLHGRLYLSLRSRRDKVLSRMLEICPSTARSNLDLVHPLGIGVKPIRHVGFQCTRRIAVNASIIDMGNRFRMIVNAVEVVSSVPNFPNFPCPRHVNRYRSSDRAAAWILAGGAHHTAFSQQIHKEFLEDFAEIAGIEFLLIDEKTNISDFKKELQWNEVYYLLNKGLR